MKNKDTQLLEEAYEDVLNSTPNNLMSVGEDIASKINEGINIRYEHPRWGKDTLFPFYEARRNISKRFTRGDHAQYMDPVVDVRLTDASAEANTLYKNKYNIDIKTIRQKALDIVSALGEHITLKGPHASDTTEAVKYKGMYILLDNPLKFGLVTKNKLKGLMHRG